MLSTLAAGLVALGVALTGQATPAQAIVEYVPEPPMPVTPTSAADLPPLLRATLEADSREVIQKGCEPLVWRHKDGAPRGTLVMLHGFSAGTWQYDSLGPRMHAEGFHVYAPRLPGHGHGPSGAREDATRLPKSDEYARYVEFAERAYREAAELGGPLSVMGLSGGADVAIAMLEAHPDIARAVLVSPFLWPADPGTGFGIGLVQGLDALTGNWGGAWLDTVPFTWGEAGRPGARAWGRPGHWDMKAGNAYALMRFGQHVLRGAGRIRTPLQIVATAADDVAAEGPMRELYAKAGGAERNAFYFFPLAEHVVHPMLHFRENPDPKSLETVTTIIRDYLVEGRAYHR